MKYQTIMKKIKEIEMSRKKLVTILVLLLAITMTGTFAYASITYVLNKTVDQNVTVGETALYTDGLLIELSSYDNYTLTFFDLEETDTSKHYLTYVYTYTILVDGKDIEVSSLSDDIVVTEFVTTDTTIAITFSLNQEKEFNSGDTINVQFYFEATEPSLGIFTATNPLNINTATAEELESIGLSELEIQRTLGQLILSDFTCANNWAIRIEVSGFLQRYEEYEIAGIIVFE